MANANKKAPAISTKVPTGMTMADYGRQIYSAQNPVNIKPTTPAATSGSSGGYGGASSYGFADEQAHANAIMTKLRNGEQLSEQGAASTLMASRPDLFRNAIQAQQQPVLPEAQQIPNFQQQANSMVDPMTEVKMAQIKATRDRALGDLSLQKQSVTPQYQQLRNQTSASTMQAAQRLREIMAAQGLGQSGENVSAQVALNTQGGQALNDLSLQENQRLNEISQAMSNVNASNDEGAVLAEANAAKAKLMMDLQQRQEDMAYKDKLFNEDVRQFDFSNSPNNPKVQGQLLENKVRALALAAQEIENSYLPDKLKSEAKLLEQKINNGSLDYETGLAQIRLIKAQTSNVGASTQLGWAELKARNDDRAYQREQDSADKQNKSLNTLTDSIDTIYVGKDPQTGQPRVNKTGLRAYILSLGLSDAQTTSLLNRYGV